MTRQAKAHAAHHRPWGHHCFATPCGLGQASAPRSVPVPGAIYNRRSGEPCARVSTSVVDGSNQYSRSEQGYRSRTAAALRAPLGAAADVLQHVVAQGKQHPSLAGKLL